MTQKERNSERRIQLAIALLTYRRPLTEPEAYRLAHYRAEERDSDTLAGDIEALEQSGYYRRRTPGTHAHFYHTQDGTCYAERRWSTTPNE